MPAPASPFKKVRRAFDAEALKVICEAHETDIPQLYGMAVTPVDSLRNELGDFYAFLDKGSSILAVAHLDTVVKHERRMCSFANTAAGPVVHSGALDDRLGAYTILELLPKLGLDYDVLVTTGEESGCSTAQYFEPPEGREYNWIIEFDRGDTDVVMYQYEDRECEALVKDSGARFGSGSFSDIAYLEHLEVKAFNWGVAYRDYHGPRGHAYLEDYWDMIGKFLKFDRANSGLYLPHEKVEERGWGYYGGRGGGRLGDFLGAVCPMCTMESLDDEGRCEVCSYCATCDGWPNDDRWPCVGHGDIDLEGTDVLDLVSEDPEVVSKALALLPKPEEQGLLRSFN